MLKETMKKLTRFFPFYPVSLWKKDEKKTKNRQNIEYLKNEKSFLEEIKTIFHKFWSIVYTQGPI